MRVSNVSRVVMSAIIAAVAICPAFAQDEERDNTSGYNAIIDNLDLLVDNYAKFLARKYDLTEEQDEYTKYLLRERAYDFLDKHEDNLRGVIDRMFDVRAGGDMGAEELIEWGKQAGPIYEEAKRIITQGNDEWREILTPEQKKIHDEDIRLMEESFSTTEDQLDRIISGDMTVEEFRSPSKARRSSRSHKRNTTPRGDDIRNDPIEDPEPRVSERPPRVSRQADQADESAGDTLARSARDRNTRSERQARQQPDDPRYAPKSTPVSPENVRDSKRNVTPPKGKNAQSKPESEWEKYVREFIEKYQLDDEQTQKANAILEDCQQQRDRYLQSKQEQIAFIDKQIAELKTSKDKDKKGDLDKLNERKQKIQAPVDMIFTQQLKPRLERLPTRAQQRAAEESAKKPSKNKNRKSKIVRPGSKKQKDD